MRVFCKLLLSFLLAANVARAESPSADAPAKAETAAAIPDSAQSAAAPKSETPARPYVDSAITFLKAFTHTNRSGPDGEKAWAEMRAVSIEKVPLKVAGKDLIIDAAAGQSNAQLVRFSKVSTWREAFDVQGVTIEKAQLRVGDEEHTGKARLKLAEKDGKWIVQSLEIE
jgi:hypothetical protein